MMNDADYVCGYDGFLRCIMVAGGIGLAVFIGSFIATVLSGNA